MGVNTGSSRAKDFEEAISNLSHIGGGGGAFGPERAQINCYLILKIIISRQECGNSV
jgi:hypothetical protein